MQRKIWTQMKDLFLSIQSELLEVHSKFNWESSFNKKFTDTQLLAIKDKVTEMETNFRADIEALTEAIENPVEDGEGDPDPFVAVTGIGDVPTTATAGTPLTLSGTVAPAAATNKTIVWSVKTAGTTGATIAGSILTTTGAGTVTITATIADGTADGTDYAHDFTITVAEPFVAVTGIEDVPDAAVAGTPLTLSGTVAPATATNKTIVWSVKAAGDTGAAITDGVFTATDAGSATITATIADGTAAGTDYTHDFTITVSAGGGS